jgi:hypothetical protein
MSGQRNNKLVVLGIALATGLVAAYANNRYDHATPTQVNVKAARGMTENVELALPPDPWPRQ